MLKKKPKQIQPTYQRNVYYPILITAFLNNPHLYEIAFIIIIISKKDLNINWTLPIKIKTFFRNMRKNSN